MAANLERILHPIGCLRLCGAPNPLPLQSGRSDNRSAAMSLLYYSCAKASRSLFSCSSGRLVEMISKSYCFSSSMILSGAITTMVKSKQR